MNEEIGIKNDGTPYKVLIVDDSALIHRMIKKSLEPFGFEIIGDALNGKEGVELFKQQRPDIITMDITMPIMDGIDAAENIIRIDPTTKILMLSAMGDEDIKEKAKEKGVSKFITKPFKPEDMLRSVSELLEIIVVE